MEIAASTTTRDILGLALLAALSERPSTRTEAVDAVRALCLPWLTPTREAVAGLLFEYCEAGFLRATNRCTRDAGSLAGALLEITSEGERELQRLVLYRTGQPAHPLVILCETGRLRAVGATQSGSNSSARWQAGALVGAVWSPFLFASLERLTCVLARRSHLLSSTAAAMRRAFH